MSVCSLLFTLIHLLPNGEVAVSAGLSNSLQQEIGLADATRIEFVEIYWPTSGRKELLKNVEMDGVWRIEEGLGEARAVSAPSFSIAPLGGAHAHHRNHQG